MSAVALEVNEVVGTFVVHETVDDPDSGPVRTYPPPGMAFARLADAEDAREFFAVSNGESRCFNVWEKTLRGWEEQ